MAVTAALEFATTASGAQTGLPIARVIDGDTVAFTNGAHVRLVQIDYSAECYGAQAPAETNGWCRPGRL